jgi:hypothetical protein
MNDALASLFLPFGEMFRPAPTSAVGHFSILADVLESVMPFKADIGQKPAVSKCYRFQHRAGVAKDVSEDIDHELRVSAVAVRHNVIVETLSKAPKTFEPIFARKPNRDINHGLLLPILFHCVDDQCSAVRLRSSWVSSALP